MKSSFSRIFLAPLAVLVLVSFAMAPLAEAARGGGRSYGGAHAGGGGDRQNVRANNNRVDVRTNNVRSTSINHVNIDRRGGCCNRGWDNDYHPVATAAAVTTTVARTSANVGSTVRILPAGCIPWNTGGYVYEKCGTVWYQLQGDQWIVIYPPE